MGISFDSGATSLDVAGFDLVEVNPPYDSSDITSILAANLIFEYLSILAVKQASR
jgi:arginase family enzyme